MDTLDGHHDRKQATGAQCVRHKSYRNTISHKHAIDRFSRVDGALCDEDSASLVWAASKTIVARLPFQRPFSKTIHPGTAPYVNSR